MTTELLIALLTVGGSVVGAAIAGFVSARSSTRQTAATMYTNLCADLSGRVDTLEAQRDRLEAKLADKDAQIKALQERITDLEKTQTDEREQWQRERAVLLSRLDAVECERTELKAQLDALPKMRTRR